MSYDVDFLCIDDLKKVFLVMDDIYTKFSLSQDYGELHFGYPNGLDGVSSDYQQIIIDKLIQEGYLERDHIAGQAFSGKASMSEYYILAYRTEFTDLYREVKNKINQKEKIINAPRFDEEKSILFIKDKEIKIAKQSKKTIAHRILKHIFDKDNLEELSAYVEIEGEEYQSELKLGKKYHSACQDIQRKIEKQTNGEIKDFLVFNSSDRGEVSINKKYL
jgi:hypothetical protein